MKIVIDTNVIASGIFFGGKPRILLEAIIQKKIDAYASPEILIEYKETVEELCSRYPQKPLHVPLSYIVASCTVVLPSSHVKMSRDPDDDKFIDCAIEGKCLYIVSGDKDLLSLEKIQDIEIITVSEFFNRFNGSEE